MYSAAKRGFLSVALLVRGAVRARTFATEPAKTLYGAAENQCRQYSAAVAPCPGFIGNHCRQVLERHLDYRVSQCELVCPRAIAHHTIGGGRTLGGDRTVDIASFAVHLSDINPRANAVVWTTTAIEAAEARWFPAHMA